MIRTRQSLPALLTAAALLAAGCGSSSSSTGRRTSSRATGSTGGSSAAGASGSTAPVPPLCPPGQGACVTTSPYAKVVGPQDVTHNLLQALAHDHKELSAVTLSCYRVTGFPKLCTVRGMWKLATNPKVPVAGELTAYGIYTGTSTYAYQLVYHQIGGPTLHKPSPVAHKPPAATATHHRK